MDDAPLRGVGGGACPLAEALRGIADAAAETLAAWSPVRHLALRNPCGQGQPPVRRLTSRATGE